MHPVRLRRLLWVCAIVITSSLIVALVLYALRANINLFYTPAEVAAGSAPALTRIRVGGMVEAGSVQQDISGLGLSFVLVDAHARLAVRYEGLLPDLFAEGRGAVATGKLNQHKVFIAEYILAKHDENYEPPVNFSKPQAL